MEASSIAHHWARKLSVLGLDPRIISAQLVEPYRSQGTSGKNDANLVSLGLSPRARRLQPLVRALFTTASGALRVARDRLSAHRCRTRASATGGGGGKCGLTALLSLTMAWSCG